MDSKSIQERIFTPNINKTVISHHFDQKQKKYSFIQFLGIESFDMPSTENQLKTISKKTI